MSSLSATSHVLHRLGCWFISTPESLSMPADFYIEKGDRPQPTSAEVYDRRIQLGKHSTDKFRRDLGFGVGIPSTIGAVLCCAVLAALLMVGKWTAKQYDDAMQATRQAEMAKQAEAAAAEQKAISRCLALTPEQQQADRSCQAVQKKQKADQKAYWASRCAQMDSEHRARSSMCQEN